MGIPNVVLGETSGNDIPIDHNLQARKYLMTYNCVYCIKHETKYNFLFMKYLNLTENINSIKEENKNYTLKYEGRNLQKKNSEIRTTNVTTKIITPITARPHHTM